MSNIKCPACGSKNFYLVQKYVSYAYIDAIHPNGNIDIGETKEDAMDGDATLECEDCYWSGNAVKYLKGIK